MLKTNILASLCLLLATVLSVTARPDLRSRDITKREPTPTGPTEDHTKGWSNGQLLAAGLKPRKPQNLYNPSRVLARHHNNQPSGTPQKQCYIKVVRQGPGNWDKYVSKEHDNNKDWYGVDEPWWKRMTVKFTPGSGPLNLEITSGGSSYPLFAFAGATLGNSNYFYSAATNPTAPGSTPQNVGNSRAPGVPTSESAIWFYDSSTQRFTAQWVQPNGSIVSPTKFWFIPNDGAIVLTKNSLNKGWEVNLYCESTRS
jgi:hypothetical protein